MSGAATLRRAVPADAQAIAGIAVRTWHHAYSDFADPRTLAERTLEQQLPLWEQRLGVGVGSGDEIWVAEAGGRVVGYAAVGPSMDVDAGAGTGLLHALYVDPPAQGGGLGGLLHGHALERLAALGFVEATLWSFADNEQARTFYEHRGWAFDASGSGLEDPHWREPAVRHRRAL